MEKRLLLATLLSFVLLYIWMGTQQKKPLSSPVFNQEQPTAEEQSKNPDTNDIITKIYPIEKQKQIKPIIPEKISTISGDKITLETTTLGATIKSVYIKKYDENMPISNIAGSAMFNDLNFAITNEKDNSIEYVYEDSNIKINKTYKIIEDDNIVQSDITILDKNEMSKQKEMSIQGLVIDVSEDKTLIDGKGPTASRDKALFEYMVNTGDNIFRKSKAYKFSEKNDTSTQKPVQWLGFRNRYFDVIVKPLFDVKGYSIKTLGAQQLSISIIPQDNIQKEGTTKLSFLTYIGPEKIEILKKYKMDFEKAKRYYKLGIFDWTAKIIRWVMFTIHKVVPNWGVCILILGALVYFSTYPMTKRSLVAMKKMQALNPKISAIKEKHKNNPQKMNKETMELYKQHKVNPLGGCLPMVFQMPIFLGLLQVLWRAVDLKGAHFLWIKDLSAPDRLFLFPQSFPIIGNELNLLPLLMIVIMFFQQKASAKNMNTSDPAQKKQQQMMTFLFPVFFGFIFYHFASGLTLYFTMYYLFSTYSQFKLSKITEVTHV